MRSLLGIFMSSVADIDFAAHLSRVPFPSSQVPAVRTYLGCLSSAIGYLDGRRIWYNNTKPTNILTKSGNILTDFGLS